MTIFTVTATVRLDYDSRDGLVTTGDEAYADMLDYLGNANPFDFTIDIEEGE